MAKQLYRPANQHTLLWIFIGLCGVAGLLLTLFSLDALGLTDGFEIGSFLLSTIPFIAAIAFGVWLLGRFNRTRVSGISALLEPEGFLFSSQPTEKSKTTFYPSMSGILASWQMDRSVSGCLEDSIEPACRGFPPYSSLRDSSSARNQQRNPKQPFIPRCPGSWRAGKWIVAPIHSNGSQ